MSTGEAIHRRLAEIAAREVEIERGEVEELRKQAAKQAEERKITRTLARIADQNDARALLHRVLPRVPKPPPPPPPPPPVEAPADPAPAEPPIE